MKRTRAQRSRRPRKSTIARDALESHARGGRLGGAQRVLDARARHALPRSGRPALARIAAHRRPLIARVRSPRRLRPCYVCERGFHLVARGAFLFASRAKSGAPLDARRHLRNLTRREPPTRTWSPLPTCPFPAERARKFTYRLCKLARRQVAARVARRPRSCRESVMGRATCSCSSASRRQSGHSSSRGARQCASSPSCATWRSESTRQSRSCCEWSTSCRLCTF